LIANTMSSRYYKDGSENLILDPFNKAERQDLMAGAVKTNQGSPTSTGTAIVEPFIKNIPHGFNDGFEKSLPHIKSNSGAQYNELLVNESRIRRLTPVECERLQSFPDRWTEGISDTQRYKCLGNAVTVNVIKFLGDRIRESINSKSKRSLHE